MYSEIQNDNFLTYRCVSCPARQYPICQTLKNNELNELADIGRLHNLTPGQMLWAEGEQISEYAIIVSGVLKLYKLLENGSKQIVGLLFVSDFLGHVFSEKSHYFVQAATDAVLCSFSKHKFENLLASQRRLEHELLKKSMGDIDKCRNWLFSLGRKTALEKVASFILMLAKKADCSEQRDCLAHADRNQTVLLPLTRLEMAHYLGSTSETISRSLTKLKNKNIIRFDGRSVVEICDPVKLEQLAG